MNGASRVFSALSAGDESSPEELCVRLGEALGLDGPAPRAVTRRALVDEVFAAHLANCRGNARLLALLFTDPRNRGYEDDPPAGAGGRGDDAVHASSLALAVQGGRAVARWGAGGFRRVAPEVFAARFGACEACDHLVDPPARVVYRVRLRRESDPRVCAACGCVAARKAALPTEHCPLPDPADPSRTRWGDPR